MEKLLHSNYSSKSYIWWGVNILHLTLTTGSTIPQDPVPQIQILPLPQNLVKLFRLASLKPVDFALLFLYCGNYNKGPNSHFPLLPLPFDSTVFPWPIVLCCLFLGICEFKNFFLHDSHFLVCDLPYLVKTNPGYILKQSLIICVI